MKFLEYLTEMSALRQSGGPKGESLLCAALAVRQGLKRSIKISDFNEENIGEYSRKYVDCRPEPMVHFKTAENKWIESSVSSANALFNSNFLKGSNYIFHRGSSLVKEIEENWYRMKPPETMKKDRWNPSDIWASKINSVKKFDSLIDFNNFINDYLKNGKLVGISVKGPTKNAKVKFFSKESATKIQYKGFRKFKSPFSSANISLILPKPGYYFVFRTFGGKPKPKQPIQGYIDRKGKNEGGKLGHGFINRYLRQFGEKEIGDYTKLERDDEIQIIQTMKDLYRGVGVNFDEKVWERGVPEKHNFWSKLSALDLLNTIDKSPNRDELITSLYNVAKSRAEFSSNFIRVS